MDTNQIDKVRQEVVEILFDLGKLRVFHIITNPEEMNKMPSRVYWADLRSQRQYGPFSSLHHAMQHYEWMARGNIQDPLPDERPDALVIHVDFNQKERIKFPIPGIVDAPRPPPKRRMW